jgi:hypothetical protein
MTVWGAIKAGAAAIGATISGTTMAAVAIVGGIVLYPANKETGEDEWMETWRRLIEICHKRCEGHLGKDPCSQGIPYTNCMKECMGGYDFGYPWPNSPVAK